MIKAKDLMLGDWILAAGKPIRVTFATLSICDNVNFKPVSLTPEILEKNGFEYEKNIGYVYEDYNSSTKVIVDFWDNTIKIVHNYDIKFNYTYYDNIMVHRFQHILKDFEIEKEIVL